jgi:hypothetical protein
MAQEPRRITVQQSASGNHLGIEEGVRRQLAEKESAVPICPIHHRRNAEFPGKLLLDYICKYLIHMGIYLSDVLVELYINADFSNFVCTRAQEGQQLGI